MASPSPDSVAVPIRAETPARLPLPIAVEVAPSLVVHRSSHEPTSTTATCDRCPTNILDADSDSVTRGKAISSSDETEMPLVMLLLMVSS
jgi:hypothetical protein